jgi:hypothetical protein
MATSEKDFELKVALIGNVRYVKKNAYPLR